jgi:large subunit ribosomal protein L10
MPRQEKVEEVARLQDRLQRAAGVILTDFRGLTVGEITQLRRKLQEAGADYRVVKNRLLGKAAQAAGIDGLVPYLEGPTAVAFAPSDPVAAAKVIQEFIRQTRKLAVKGSVVAGRVYGEAQTRALADLPGRQELVARVVGGVAAPLVALAGVLGGVPRGLVVALDQLRRRREAAGAAAE